MGEILGSMSAVMDAGWSEEGMDLGLPDWAGEEVEGESSKGKERGKGRGNGEVGLPYLLVIIHET